MSNEMNDEEDKIENEEVKDNLEEVENTEETTDSQEEESTESELVKKAKSTGHLSKEEFIAKGGRPEDYKTEREFALTGELIDLKKTLNKRDKDIEDLLKYHQMALERQREAARAEVDRQREAARAEIARQLQEAREMGDVDSVARITAEQVRAEQSEASDKQRREAQEHYEVLQDFAKRNAAWFNEEHPELLNRCAELEKLIARQNPNISKRQMADEIEAQVKFEMSRDPKYMRLTTQTEARPNLSANRSAVAQSGSNVSDASDDKLYTKLSSEEKAMYNILKRNASKVGEKYPVKEFIEQLKADGSI